MDYDKLIALEKLPNGRNAGTPLNDSVGAFEGADVKSPTALTHSVTNLPLEKAIDTNSFEK